MGTYINNGTGGGARVGQGQYNNYNAAMNAINDWGTQNQDNWNNVGGSTYNAWTEKVKTRGGHHKKENHERWYVNPNSGNHILDDYVSGGSALGSGYNYNTRGWGDYANQASNQFNQTYNNTSKNLYDQAQNQYTGMYDPYNNESNFNSLIGSKDTSQYGDASDVLKRDLARGYLSQAGYQTALNKLNNQQATNQQNLRDLGLGQYNAWKDALGQEWANNIDTLDNNSWMKYYNNWNNYDGANMNQLFSNAQNAVGDYANAYINDDIFNNAIDVSLYDPDSYTAQGAQYQGMYNPFNRSVSNRRRRVTLDNIGEF